MTHHALEELEHGLGHLDAPLRRVIRRLVRREYISRDVNQEYESGQSPGGRLADAVAAFGGSWPFVIFFLLFILSWIFVNSLLLTRLGKPFDPYPYILLNLFLSTLAAVQAPIILMSQNRQSQKDRQQSQNDFEVNLKAEAEIMALHEKLDELRERRWHALVEQQEHQIELLHEIVAGFSAQGQPVER